jgi:hypothetical protein
MGIAYNTSIVRNGLVLHLDAANVKSYTGSGTTWSDLSGNGNNGTLVNSVGFSSDNKGVLTFDGIDDYIDLTTEYTLLQSGGALNCWCYVTDFTPVAPVTVPSRIFVTRNTNNFSSQIAFYEGGFGYETITNSNPFELASRTTPNVSVAAITAQKWFNFTIVFSGGNTSNVYVNGILVNTVTNISNDLIFRYIGHKAGPNNYPDFFKGRVGNMQLYSRSLSEAEVKQNFEATRGRYGI